MTVNIETPVVQQEKVEPVQNNTEQKNNLQQTEQEAAPKNSKQWDEFKAARQAERDQAKETAKQAKKSQEEAMALKAALDAVLNKPQQAQQNNYQTYDPQEETEEQRIAKHVNEALAKRDAEYERQRQQREQQEYPQRLSSDFKDFDQVCSSENLDYLDYHYPEVAKAFAHMPQGYDKWSSIYKAVKRFIPNPDAKKEAGKAEKNFNKPQSSSSPGVTQQGDNTPGFKLDEKKKAENWARMQKAMNRLDSK